ncbi:preprotein translocase subunit yajc [Rhodococcus ruber BKS 20-38]|uniref:Preprotein translocase subunit yajc n=1 Tax=Rhodococcus ruber BKS 20-38 TaxID=1278076 RepID=M2ZZ56_9NOCA|nr:preprotein translocase subunit YajC [Rhodococcus ruber]EME65993.1 preprotein translocase subunit yajc [Rhodococcus ruber BKS 20-38]
MELLFPLLILALLVPTFLGIRRQKKEMQKTAELQDALQVGDRVMTTAGLHAAITALTDTTVELEIAPGVVTTWARVVVRERITDLGSTDETTGGLSLDKGDDTEPPAGRPTEH